MDYNEQSEREHSDARWHYGVERTDDEAWEIVQTALLMEIRDELKELNETSQTTKSLIQWIKEWWEENGWTPRI